MAWAETGSYSGVPTYKCHETQKMCEIAKEDVRDSLPEECRGGIEE
jgi:hypothetical protein